MPVALADFEAAAAVLLRMLRDRSCHVIVLAPMGRQTVQFVFDSENQSVRTALEEARISSDDLARASADVAEALVAAMEQVGEDQFAERRSNPGQRGEPEDANIARRKLNLVEEQFDVALLRRRAWIKQTSKARVPLGLDWEVNAKFADDDHLAPDGSPIPYGTLIVRTASRSSPFSMLDDRSDAPIDVDKDDVEVMIASLRRLHQALADADTRGEGG